MSYHVTQTMIEQPHFHIPRHCKQWSAQNTYFAQQDSPVKMCFILYTLGLDTTKGSAILYNISNMFLLFIV